MLAYFDCFSGISGNMILGALLDAGLSLDVIKKELKKIGMKGYSIRVTRVNRGHLTGLYVKVNGDTNRRKLKDIIKILEDSLLDSDVKKKCIEIFKNIAKAESRVHGIPGEKLHFHEIGDIDSIIDIAGAVIGLKKLGVKAVHASRVHTGTGFVKTRGGLLPVPAPATVELLKGVPVYGGDVKAELVTPTGAAILTAFAEFGEMPPMKYERVGYGAGRDMEHPNVLRVFIGRAEKGYLEDRMQVIETNIDDMNPQLYEHLSSRLFECGAVDVMLMPVQMKKNRPATLLKVLTDSRKLDEAVSIIFEETTTFGVRTYEVRRKKLFRRMKVVKTKYGNVLVKEGSGGGIKKVAPEYEDCRRLAEKHKVPLKKVYDEVKKKA